MNLENKHIEVLEFLNRNNFTPIHLFLEIEDKELIANTIEIIVKENLQLTKTMRDNLISLYKFILSYEEKGASEQFIEFKTNLYEATIRNKLNY